VPDEEEELASLLAWAIRTCSAELPTGYHFGAADPDSRMIEVEAHKPENVVDRLLVAICNKSAKGGGLGKQLGEVEKRAGETPVVLVRTTDFPRTQTSQVVKQIAQLLKRDGRRVVVEDSEWRQMLAFRSFGEKHGKAPGFADWQKHGKAPGFADWQKIARPLGELPALQKVLQLNQITAPSVPSRPNPPAPPPAPPSPAVTEPTPRPSLSPTVVPGLLRLGRSTNLQAAPVELDPHELIQHAAFLGGSGSGKTTAALNVIEQLLEQGIPAIFIDRKGDLCRYADPSAWSGATPDPARLEACRRLRERLEVAVFTPGEPRGRLLGLKIVPVGFDQLPETDREQFAQHAAAALGTMMGFKGNDADRSQLAVLAKAIQVLAHVKGAEMTVERLRKLIEDRDDALLYAIGGGYPDRVYEKLAERLLTLWLNNKLLLSAGDETLDIDALLGNGASTGARRTRLSVISTRFLTDPVKADFWVAQLLIALGRWCGKAPASRLQAVILFDEADVYLPAVRQPATKAPMENLLKRARSAGLGIFLASQSPGDFDYKCKENVRTWLLGRIKEPRALEKLRPMLAAAKINVIDKLAGQGVGQFYVVREQEVIGMRCDPSLVSTEQVPEERIIELARSSRQMVI
jgi:hypothetical protein